SSMCRADWRLSVWMAPRKATFLCPTREPSRKSVGATSKDGARVPFFLTARKGIALDGSHSTMMYAYGGFSISTLPSYRTDVPAWFDVGGIWVTASIRGGAEYGEAWHKAGRLEKKQN